MPDHPLDVPGQETTCPAAVVHEHGPIACITGPVVCRLLHLSAQPLGTIPVRNVVYLVRAEIANTQHIAAQVKHLNR